MTLFRNLTRLTPLHPETTHITGTVGSEVMEAADIMSRVGTLFEVLAEIGFVVSVIAIIIEIVDGAEQ
jgi:uncharacterized membrane protein